MNLSHYFKDKAPAMILQIIFLFLSCLYLAGLGLGFQQYGLIPLIYGAGMIIYYTFSFFRLRKKFRAMAQTLEQMEEKYLFPQVMPSQKRYEDCAWLAIMEEMSRSMTTSVEKAQNQSKDYQDFIESWVHEIKQPVASIHLICSRSPGDETDRIRARAQEINQLLQKVLYYAKSRDLSRDMMITTVDLRKVLLSSIQDQGQVLRLCHFTISLPDSLPQIYTDEKALLFIFNQLITNAVAYRNPSRPCLTISCTCQGPSARVTVMDNGAGILPQDLPRVFDKGFTGHNGRKNKASTGIGLYLCRQLCGAINADIAITSKVDRGTFVELTLPLVRPDVR